MFGSKQGQTPTNNSFTPSPLGSASNDVQWHNAAVRPPTPSSATHFPGSNVAPGSAAFGQQAWAPPPVVPAGTPHMAQPPNAWPAPLDSNPFAASPAAPWPSGQAWSPQQPFAAPQQPNPWGQTQPMPGQFLSPSQPWPNTNQAWPTQGNQPPPGWGQAPQQTGIPPNMNQPRKPVPNGAPPSAWGQTNGFQQ